jgi:hypothetical protein
LRRSTRNDEVGWELFIDQRTGEVSEGDSAWIAEDPGPDPDG